MRPFGCIDINCINRLRFLAEISTKLPKMHFFENWRTITQEENMKTRQMTPFFSSTFSTLFVCNTHFCNWKLVPSLVHSGLSNTWIFGQKLPIQTAHYTFLESRHHDITKNLYCFVHPPGSNTHFFRFKLIGYSCLL